MWRLIVLVAPGVIAAAVGCGKSSSPSPVVPRDIGEAPSGTPLDLPATSALEQFAAAREILTMYPDSLADGGRAPVINDKPIRLPPTSADAVKLCAQLLGQATQGAVQGLPEQERMEALQLMRHCDAVFS
ncbi:MAG TPA: hypothetical protein VGN42_02220, partial [Pirellulales bacterium]|nr:hypothetical protein [Pirellulales bacterium]